MALLSKYVRKRQNYLIKELKNNGYFKFVKAMSDEEINTVPLSELEAWHIDLKCRIGKQIK